MTDNTDLLTDLLTPSKSNFRLQNQKLLLTYKTHLDKQDYCKWLLAIAKQIKTIYIAHENGTDDPITPYEHTHIVVDFGIKLISSSAAVLDYFSHDMNTTIHPHISIINKPYNWKKACKYICKEDKNVKLNADDEFNGVDHIWANNTIQQALAHCSLRDVSATIQVFNHKPMDLPEPEITEDQFYNWQKKGWELLQREPTGRKITWIYDESGNTGKTRFAKWMCLCHPHKAVMLNNVGKVSDFAMNMKTFWDTGFRGDTVFLNLSRAYADKAHLYEALEIIADGYLTCTKYTGGVVWLPKMHIVVLANFEPQTECLSQDRWELWRIDSNLCLEGRPSRNINREGRFNPMGN